VKQASLYGFIILVGVVAVFGTGIATFVLGERLSSQKAVPTGIPELESVSGDIKEFQLVVKETEVNFECLPEQITERDQGPPDFRVILVNELPDPHTPDLVSFSGCPLADRCSNRAAETY
jgi:hypothetical protein